MGLILRGRLIQESGFTLKDVIRQGCGHASPTEGGTDLTERVNSPGLVVLSLKR